jgi:hypothetical protein
MTRRNGHPAGAIARSIRVLEVFRALLSIAGHSIGVRFSLGSDSVKAVVKAGACVQERDCNFASGSQLVQPFLRDRNRQERRNEKGHLEARSLSKCV